VKEMFDEIEKAVEAVCTGSATEVAVMVITARCAVPKEAVGVAAARGTTDGAV
jgi:hypothetical protein